nr:hypothetical protein [Acholeplasma laidlawii]
MKCIKKIAPAYIEDISDIHKTEPYVYSQMIAGKEAKRHGEAKNSWLTGTSAWNFVAISQYILGIQPEFDGLSIKPVLPDHLNELEITRKFRQNTYIIKVIRTGKQMIEYKGRIYKDHMIPYVVSNQIEHITVHI